MIDDTLVTVIIAYLVGSVPSAWLLTRLVGGNDIRESGEGNVGARNVFHVVGPRWGIATFLADFGKGALVAALVRGDSATRVALAGAAVLIGHAYPVWLGFVGGKGLSTVGGFVTVLMPWAAAIGGAGAAATWRLSHQFLPTTVVAIVAAIVVAPITGVDRTVVGVVVGLFLLTGVKRALDEGRMRAVEARTGWDRTRGLRP